jgi:hypothetical protein
MKTKPKKNPRPWYWPYRRYYVDRLIRCPRFAVLRNSDVTDNITVFAECESARNAAKIARMMNAEEKGKRNA